MPSFEPLHLPQLIVTAVNHRIIKVAGSSCPASPSMSVHADIPSDTSLRLRPHLAHYIHTLGVKLASVKNFGSFFASPLVKEHSELQPLEILPIPWQCRGSRTVTFLPRAAHAGDWCSAAVATRCGGNGGGGDGSGGKLRRYPMPRGQDFSVGLPRLQRPKPNAPGHPSQPHKLNH